ncbi:MAG: hypothetical protein ACE5D6_08890, partial [Candidatus Zixiibacteriota bacterium]
MSVKIVEFQETYLNQLVEFFKQNSEDHPELYDIEIIHWQRCRRYLALFNNEIVGHIAQIPHTIKCGNKSINFGWAATLILDTSNPMVQVFAGTALLNHLTKQKEIKFAAVGVVPEIENTHKRRGFNINYNATSMFARFFHPAKALSFLNKPEIFSLPIKLVNVVFRISDSYKKTDIQKISEFDSEWDQKWDYYLSHQYLMYGERKAEFLNYKIKQPKKKYFAYIAKDNDGKINGYTIFRVAINKVKDIMLLKVCDLVGSLSARKALLGYATNYSQEIKAVSGVGYTLAIP